jgi:hypothetical protein
MFPEPSGGTCSATCFLSYRKQRTTYSSGPLPEKVCPDSWGGLPTLNVLKTSNGEIGEQPHHPRVHVGEMETRRP